MFKDRDLSDYIEDICGAIAEIAEFTEGMTFEEFTADKKLQMPSFEVLKLSVRRRSIFRREFEKIIRIFHGVKWRECEMF